MAKKKRGSVKKAVKKKPALKKKAAGKAIKKPIKKKAVKKPQVKKAPTPAKKVRGVIKKLKADVIGKVTHYFPHVRAAVIKLEAPLAVGDTIKIKGHTTDFTQKITSIQINHVVVEAAKKGDEIGLLVNSRVRQHDIAYREKK